MPSTYTAQRVIFLHIPKAAGTTLERILVKQYSREQTFVLQASELLPTLKDFPAQQRSQIRLLSGHMAYGAHECFAEPSVYVSMIRHPVQRLISHYRFVLARPHHYLYGTVASRKIDLEEYVHSGISTETDNGQVRLLAGHARDIPYGHCSELLLEKAKQNILEHFAFVGISEEFDRSLVLMSRKLHWANVPAYRRANVATSPPPKVGEETIRAIERSNALDLELYEWVKARVFSEWEAEAEQLNRVHRRFLVRNRVYQAVTDRFRPVKLLARRAVRRVAASV